MKAKVVKIATVASGARQQSRFIAMMSNYSKTMELVNAANNSAGASQRQYEKTLDSLETKLAKLKNAWNEFTMGLSNNEFIKAAVDALTGLLTTINKIIGTISGGSGVIKSALSILTAIGGLKLGKSLLFSITDKVGGGREGGFLQRIFGKKPQLQAEGMQAGQAAGQGFKAGFQAVMKGAKKNGLKGLFSSVTRDFTQEEFQKGFKMSQIDFSNVDNKSISDFMAAHWSGLSEGQKKLFTAQDTANLEAYNKKCQELDITLVMTGQKAKAMGASFKESSKNLSAVATAAGVASGALMGIASLLETTGSSGEKAAGVIRGFATVLMGSVPVIQMVQNAMVTGATSIGAAISSIPVIGWITAIISTVIGLVQVIKAVWPESEQEKLERLEGTQQKLAEGAKSAQEAYDNLNSSLSELGEAKKTLDSLVQGTLEWKKQLLQVNSQVLELINKYPQLEYVRGQNGLLEITDSSIDTAIKAQYKAAENANALSAFGQLAVSGQKVSVRQDELDDAIIEAVTHSAYASEEILREKIENDPSWRVTEEFASQTKMSSKAMDELNRALDSVSQSLLELNSQAQTYSATIYGERAKGYEDTPYYNQILEGVAVANADKVSESTEKWINNLEASNPMDIFGLQDTLINHFAETLGVTDQSGSIRTYQEVLAKITDQSIDEIEKLYTDKDSIIPVIAEAIAMREIGNNIPALFKKMSGASDQKQASLYAGLYSGGGNLSLSQAKSFNREDAQQFLEQNGFTALDFGFDTMEELLDSLEQSAENNIASFKQSQSELQRSLGSNDWAFYQKEQASQLMENQSLQTTQAYFDQLTQLYARGGKEAVSAFQASFTDILSKVPESQRQKVMDIVTSTDLSDLDGVKLMFEEIEKVAPGTVGQLGGMEKAIVELGKATKKVNLQSTLSEVKSLLDLADDIEGRDRSQGVSQEELDQIVKAGAADYSDFFFTGQEFIPVTNSMEGLAEAVRANTDAILEETMTRLKQQIGSGEYVEELFNSAKWGDTPADQKNRIVSGEATAADWQIVRDVLGMGGASQEEVMAKYRSYLPDYLNLAENRQQVEEYGNYAAQAEAFQKDPQELFNRTKTVTGTMANDTKGTSRSWVKNENYDANAEQYLDAQVAANSLGKTVEKLTGDYRENGNTVLSNSKIMKAHALRWNNSEKKIKTLCETVKDTTEAFNAGTKALKNGETPANDYNIALEKIKKAGQEVFGKGFDDKFIQENSELVARLAEGGEIGAAAFDQIQQKISSGVLEQLQNFNQQLLNAEELMAELNGVESEFKVNGTADVTQLMQMLMEAGKTADEAAAKIEALTGATVTYDVEYQDVLLPIGSKMDAQGQLEIGNGKNGGKLGFEKVAIPHVIKAVGSKNTYSGSGFSGGSSGGGGGGSSKNWQNPYDELYNLTEKINEALRRREKLEREYSRILERRGSTYQELSKNYSAQLASLEKELSLQKELQAGRERQINKVSSEKYTDSEGNVKTFAETGATKYGRYDKAENRIIIDWNAIDKVTDENLGGAIEAYISRLEELQSQFEETDEKIEDIEDRIDELKKDKMQDYLDFESKVYDAIVQQRQEIIDNFQSLSDTISENNTSILDSLQESIDLERQIRDNTKTEEDINEKEARLAYLRRDTSNANALEIKQLEEELTQAREDYTDTLVDQKLEELRNQNDKAQEAREKQIELMQTQLDWQQKNGEFWDKTHELIQKAFGEDGTLKSNSELVNLLKETEGFKGMSKFGQMNWSNEISKGFLAAIHGYSQWEQYAAENITHTAKLGDGSVLTYNTNTGKWTDSAGNVHENVRYDANAGYFTSNLSLGGVGTSGGSEDNIGNLILEAAARGDIEAVASLEAQRDAKITREKSNWSKSGGGIAREMRRALELSPFNPTEQNPDYGILRDAALANGDYRNAVFYEMLRNRKIALLGLGYAQETGAIAKFLSTQGKTFKTGGLADFTGPAWLDGSRSKPELVLNARDTENFLMLRDVLGSLSRNSDAIGRANGDNYFDIQISVDEIGSDYDVDQLARRIKQQITEDSTYRNVNAISFIR